MLFLTILSFMSAVLALRDQIVVDRLSSIPNLPAFPKPPPSSNDRCAIISFQLQSAVYPHPNGCVTGQQDRCCCQYGTWVEVGVPASSRSSRTPATKASSYTCCHGPPTEQPNGYRYCETAAVTI